MFVCLSVCAKDSSNLWTNFHEARWVGGTWPRHESIRFFGGNDPDPGLDTGSVFPLFQQGEIGVRTFSDIKYRITQKVIDECL